MPRRLFSVPTLGGQSCRWGGALPGPGGPSAPCGRSGLRGPLAPSAGIRPCCAPALPVGPLSAFVGMALRGQGFGFESGSLGDLVTTTNPNRVTSATWYRYRGLVRSLRSL